MYLIIISNLDLTRIPFIIAIFKMISLTIRQNIAIWLILIRVLSIKFIHFSLDYPISPFIADFQKHTIATISHGNISQSYLIPSIVEPKILR